MSASISTFKSKPHAFLAQLRHKSHAADTDRRPASLPLRVAFETTDSSGEVSYAEPDMLTNGPDGTTFVILSGNIYRPASANIGQTILSLYARHGADFVRELNGSFALMLVDQQAGVILFATDRLNSLKLLSSQQHGVISVSNSMEIHPVRGAQIDATAVACALVAGFAYNNRSMLEGIRVLEGGSMYRLRGAALEQQRYWQYQPSTPVETPAIAAELQRELEDAIVDATAVRLRGDRPVYISLTAGYDSRAILGVLTERLRVPNIHAFTYTYGDALPQTDEALAPRLAALQGVEHRLIPSFKGNLIDLLTGISQWGVGMTDLCDELDTWRALEQETAGGPRPLLFTGDITMISSDSRLASVADVVTVARMPDFSAARWIEPLIGRGQYDTWVEATRSEITQTLKRYEPTTDYYTLRDKLRFNGRDSGVFGPWRECFAGRVFEIASPMNDERVIDAFMKMPTSLRRGKKLYHATTRAMFPELFAIPRASSANYATYWPSAFRQQAAELRRWILEQPSPLDVLIEPRVLLALLDSDLTAYARTYTHFRLILKKTYRWLRSISGSPPIFARPSLALPVAPAHRVLGRALMLRSYFQTVQARQSH